MQIDRRTFVAAVGAIGAAAIVRPVARAATASDPTPIEVAYAGSMTSLVEGPLKAAALKDLGLDLHGRPQGASGLAALIAGGSISPDVFISVTASPIRTTIAAKKVERAVPIARTRMVIAYTRNGPRGKKFAAIGKRGAEPWYAILSEPGVRFGRTDPATDPQGRNIVFTMQLAEKLYRRDDLVAKILGPLQNPTQIFAEPSVEARLQGGTLDAASAYAVQPGAFGVPYVDLPPEIDLGDEKFAATYATASLSLDGKTYRPEPLVYYAATVAGGAHPAEAMKFVAWLAGSSAQALFALAGYDAPGGSAALS